MNAPKYQIVVKNKAGDAVGEFSTFFNLKYGDVLDNYGQASFAIPIDSKDLDTLVSLRKYEVNIIRDGVTKWSGEQVNADVTIQANNANLVTITCFTYPEMLNSRYTLPFVEYDSTDQAQILKNLVDESQARTDGDFGFTFADITATMDRDRTYELSNILEAFINMSNVINGVDFWIDTDKVIHFASQRGVDRSTQYSLELGINIQQVKISDNFATPGNTVFATGQNDGIEQIAPETYADVTARETYLLREQVISAVDVSEGQTLQDKAQDFVSRNKNQVRTIGITQLPNTSPTINQLDPGDSINVKIKKGRYDIDSSYRIYAYEVTIGTTGEESVVWTVARI